MTHHHAPVKPKHLGEWKATTTHGVDTIQLTVLGIFQEPTPGYKLTLTRHEPQGANPNILLLDLAVQPPHGIEPDHVVETPAEFMETFVLPNGHVPKKVTILPDDITIEVHAAPHAAKA